MNKIISTPLLVLFFLTQTRAQDRHFAWSYNTPSLPPGNVDVEVWNTYGTGREGHYYTQLQQRLEFEIGLTDMIQTSVYLNAMHSASGPMATDAELAMSRSSEFSFSNAWKFYFLNPYQNPFGFSAYAEYYLGQGETELEGKLMFDKFLENDMFVLNATAELELESEFTRPTLDRIETETESEWKFEYALGYMHLFSPRFGIGAEIRDVMLVDEGILEYSAVYLGPTVFVGSEKFFLIFNYMPQIANLAGFHKPYELNEEQRRVFRVLFGLSL